MGVERYTLYITCFYSLPFEKKVSVVLLCRLGQPQTCREPPASASVSPSAGIKGMPQPPGAVKNLNVNIEIFGRKRS